MRIDPRFGPQQAAENERTNSSPSGSAAANSTRLQIGQDQALLSGAHLQVQALAAEASQLPEVREERVAALRQAIQSGLYDMHPEKIAGALMAHMALAPTS